MQGLGPCLLVKISGGGINLRTNPKKTFVFFKVFRINMRFILRKIE